MTDQLLQLLGQQGAAGMMALFLVWDRLQQAGAVKERNKLDQDRTAADLEVAKALTQLSERLNHVR